MFQSKGTLHYYNNTALIKVDPEIVRYYRALLPPYIKTNIPLHPAHISVVRKEISIPNKDKFWKAYEGEVIEFTYDGWVHNCSLYYLINVLCPRARAIREELGCPTHWPTFHITIGNTK